jgi:two-component system KDP operon response regulator KdpE
MLTTTFNKKILVIDDEDDIRLIVSTVLERAGYSTVEAADGLEGLRRLYDERPGLVVLDVAMPGMDGWKVLERIREMSNVMVLMLTAATQEKDVVRGLKGGADGYITKPFSGEEFLARVEAVFRRANDSSEASESSGYHDSEVTIDYPRHEVTVRGQTVELTPMEFRLLGTLTENAGLVLGQDRLLDLVWGRDYFGTADVVRSYIVNLRRKIERDPSNPKLIETNRGFGYRYRKPVS